MVARDSGYNGQIRSLGGRFGAPGRGLDFNTGGGTAAALLDRTTALDANPMRVWAWIQNVGDVELVIGLGDQSNTLYLTKYQIFVINHDFPWTGAVTVAGNGATCLFYTGEYSVAGV